jgi:hypothetical protein
MMKFRVEVNPFTRKAIISCDWNNYQHEWIMYYDDIDEWNSFQIDYYLFDIHFLYDFDFSVSIYPVKNNSVDYEHECDVDLVIKLTE